VTDAVPENTKLSHFGPTAQRSATLDAFGEIARLIVVDRTGAVPFPNYPGYGVEMIRVLAGVDILI
jgi:hypothetical protein